MSAASPRLQSVNKEAQRETQRSGGDKLAAEPSMEEILASIRRIIADDQAAAQPLPPTVKAEEEALAFEIEAEEDISPEPEVKAAPRPEPAAPTREAAQVKPAPVNTASANPASARPAPANPATPESDDTPAGADKSLLSAVADATAASAFDQLSALVLSSRPRTLDDLVKEMLRPMLREWLDSHLPPLVEKLVKSEIERIARGTHL